MISYAYSKVRISSDDLDSINVAYLADQLHVTILNTVVNHLDEMASALITNPVAAGLAIRLGSNTLENVFDEGPCLLITTGHKGRSFPGTLLTTGNTGTNEADLLLSKVPGAAIGIREMRVATIDNDIAGVEEGKKGSNKVINGRTSLNEQHYPTRALQLLAQVLDRFSPNNRFSYGE